MARRWCGRPLTSAFTAHGAGTGLMVEDVASSVLISIVMVVKVQVYELDAVLVMHSTP